MEFIEFSLKASPHLIAERLSMTCESASDVLQKDFLSSLLCTIINLPDGVPVIVSLSDLISSLKAFEMSSD